MDKLILQILLVLILVSFSSSAEFQIDNKESWDKGNFNGTFYNNSGNLLMGYSNESNDDLEAFWRMDEDVSSSGGELTDYSSNGFDAVAYGVETASEGILSSNAVNFDGSGDYLAIRDKEYTTPGQIEEITVCSWVRSSDSNGEYGNFIASFDRSEYWRFSFEDDNAGHIAWDTTGLGGNTNDLGTSQSYADGEWHHACAWYDSDSNPSKKIFVDGIRVASANAHGGGIGTGTTRYGFIGTGSEASSFNGDQGNQGARFNGSIDEFRIHDRALSDYEINRSYFFGVGGEYKSQYTRRYSENFLIDNNERWREGEFNVTEAWNDGLGLRRVKDVKIGTLDAESGKWNKINYPGFSSPVIVATSENTGNGNGLISEVKNVSNNHAFLRVCDSDGRGSCESSSGYKIHYVAVDADSVNNVEGLEAGTFNIDGEFTSTSKQVDYSESFSNTPIPFTTVQSVEGASGIEARISSFGTGGFTGGICQQNSQDSCNGGHTTETVGWIAIERGNNPFPNSEIGTTGTVVGDSNWNTQSFQSLEDPAGLVSGLSENGGQELQIDEVRNIQTDRMDVRYCEIESGDNCDSHTEENLGWMAIEQGEYSLSSEADFNTSGTYSSKIFDAGRRVYWKEESLDFSEPTDTELDITYGVNSSGNWVYYDSFPKDNYSRFLRFNVSLSGNSTRTPRINSIDLKYSDSENKTDWQSITADSDLPQNTTVETSIKAVNYSGDVIGQDSVNLVDGVQSYSLNIPESEDTLVEFDGRTTNISRSWVTDGFTLSTEPSSICDFVTERNECVMNETRGLSNTEYEISQFFVSEPSAELEALNGMAIFNLSNQAQISGLWKGSFRIDSDSIRIKSGASFKSENGDIIIRGQD